jgi:stage III sporulation protein SpoIIIAA
MTQENNQAYTIDQVIADSFDFSAYSDQERESVIDEISSMIMEASLLRSLTDASDEVQDSFQTFIESEPNEEAMVDFIKQHFPEFEDVVVDEISTFLNSKDAQEIAPRK